MGIDAYNHKDEDLDDTKKILLEMLCGKVAYAVQSFGVFLGMGGKLFAMSWNALKLDTVNKRFTLNVGKDRINDAPGFDKDAWPDMADLTCWLESIFTMAPNRITDPQA